MKEPRLTVEVTHPYYVTSVFGDPSPSSPMIQGYEGVIRLAGRAIFTTHNGPGMRYERDGTWKPTPSVPLTEDEVIERFAERLSRLMDDGVLGEDMRDTDDY